MGNIENEARGYQDLIDEIEKEADKIHENVQLLLVGVIGGNKLSEQEYNVFIARALNKNKFGDIAINLRINESSAKTYYQRAIKKLNKTANQLKYKFLKV